MYTASTPLTARSMVYLGPRLQATHALLSATDVTSFEASRPLGEHALAAQGVELPKFAAPACAEDLSSIRKSITARACPSFSGSVKTLANLPPAYLPAALRIERLSVESLQHYVDARLIRFDHAGLLRESARMASSRRRLIPGSSLVGDMRALKEYLVDPAGRWHELKDRLSDIFRRYNGHAVRERSLIEAAESLHATADDQPVPMELIIAHRAEVIGALRAGIWERLSLDLLTHAHQDEHDLDLMNLLQELGVVSSRVYAQLTWRHASPFYHER